jgi:hypothetical protein
MITRIIRVSLKRVMHKFCYSTYAFSKTLHMKKRDLILALLMIGAIESDRRREALIPGATKNE